MDAGAADPVDLLDRPPEPLRQAVRHSLQSVPDYERLDDSSRRAIAHSLVRIAHAARLLDSEAGGPATTPPAPPGRTMAAGDRLSGRAVDSAAGTTHAMLKAISFPRFVNELITGVFKALVQTNQQQLQQYVELVRGVSQSLEGFSALGGGGDDMAKRWLAEQFPQSFEIEAPDPDDANDPPDPEDVEPLRLISRGPAPGTDALRAALSLEPGEPVPSGGAAELVPFVKRALARNRQQMLATMVQMGMQRIVVDSGRISAGMRFHIDAASAAAEQSHTGFDTRTNLAASASASLGWWSASASVSSTIGYVQTTDVQTKEEVNASAELTSSVELHFRTDQVPLDRIASQQTVQRLQLNTLNPERELQIAAETDRARISASQAIDAARAPRPDPKPPPDPPAAPNTPPLDAASVSARARPAEAPAKTAQGAAKPAEAPAKTTQGAPKAAEAPAKTTQGAPKTAAQVKQAPAATATTKKAA